MIRSLYIPVLACTLLGPAAKSNAADWPLFGGTPSRNMVNLIDKNIPVDWSVEEGKRKNILWEAKLGNKTYGGPVIAGGRVFVGTNNEAPRDKTMRGNKSVLMCFDEKTGNFLWQRLHDAPQAGIFSQVVEGKYGLLSTPVVDAGRVYYVLPESVVVCVKAENGDIVWTYDMNKKLGVIPFHCSNCSPLIVGQHLFLVTGNGIDDQTGKPTHPKAASFIALDKDKGTLVWEDNRPGERIFEGQWSNPTYARHSGQTAGHLPRRRHGPVQLRAGHRQAHLGIPLLSKECQSQGSHARQLHRGHAGGARQQGLHRPGCHAGTHAAALQLCPVHRRHEDRRRLAQFARSHGGAEQDDALVWSFGGPVVPAPKKERSVNIKTTISTCAIHNGLLYIAEEAGFMHCLDAATGKRQWVYDFKTGVWGSPYCVDGKVYIGTEDGEIVIFEQGRKLKVIARSKWATRFTARRWLPTAFCSWPRRRSCSPLNRAGRLAAVRRTVLDPWSIVGCVKRTRARRTRRQPGNGASCASTLDAATPVRVTLTLIRARRCGKHCPN